MAQSAYTAKRRQRRTGQYIIMIISVRTSIYYYICIITSTQNYAYSVYKTIRNASHVRLVVLTLSEIFRYLCNIQHDMVKTPIPHRLKPLPRRAAISYYILCAIGSTKSHCSFSHPITRSFFRFLTPSP